MTQVTRLSRCTLRIHSHLVAIPCTSVRGNATEACRCSAEPAAKQVAIATRRCSHLVIVLHSCWKGHVLKPGALRGPDGGRRQSAGAPAAQGNAAGPPEAAPAAGAPSRCLCLGQWVLQCMWCFLAGMVVLLAARLIWMCQHMNACQVFLPEPPACLQLPALARGAAWLLPAAAALLVHTAPATVPLLGWNLVAACTGMPLLRRLACPVITLRTPAGSWSTLWSALVELRERCRWRCIRTAAPVELTPVLVESTLACANQSGDASTLN